MRIIVAGTCHYPASNGQAVFTENLAEGLARHGHEVLSIFPSEKGPAYREMRNGVQIEAIQSLNLNWIHNDTYFSLFSQKPVLKILQDFCPDIVHIQDHFPLSQDVVVMARQLGLPLIGTNHFMPENLAAFLPGLSKLGPIFKRTLWAWMLGTYNQLHLATAQSRASADIMRANGLRIPVFPVSCGIDLERFKPDPTFDRQAFRLRYGLDPKRKLFLFVGRIDGEKHLDVILRAMHILGRDDIQFVIAGHGAARQKIQAQAEGLGLGAQVRFTGFIPSEDLPGLLNSADVFTMPSEAELLSIATLEAMSTARPVLLANAVALPELASNGVNGYLFRPGDPADAARCMALLADHPEKWAQMGQRSLEKANLHSLEHTLKEYERLYAGMLAGAFENLPKPASRSLRAKRSWLVGDKK